LLYGQFECQGIAGWAEHQLLKDLTN